MGVRIAKVSALVVPVAGIALQVSLLVVLGVGGFRVASGAITIASLVTFIMFLFLLIAPLGSSFGAITSVNQALGALGRIQEVLDLPDRGAGRREVATALRRAGGTGSDRRMPARPRPRSSSATCASATPRPSSPPARRPRPRRAPCSRRRTSTRDERMPDRRRMPTVRPATCCAASRSRCRAAHASRWSGRAARARARRSLSIERFYDPTGGAIVLDGRDVRTLDRDELRAQLGYVEQDAPTLAGTIADNLRLGSPDGIR